MLDGRYMLAHVIPKALAIRPSVSAPMLNTNANSERERTSNTIGAATTRAE